MSWVCREYAPRLFSDSQLTRCRMKTTRTYSVWCLVCSWVFAHMEVPWAHRPLLPLLPSPRCLSPTRLASGEGTVFHEQGGNGLDPVPVYTYSVAKEIFFSLLGLSPLFILIKLNYGNKVAKFILLVIYKLIFLWTINNCCVLLENNWEKCWMSGSQRRLGEGCGWGYPSWCSLGRSWHGWQIHQYKIISSYIPLG